MGPYKYLIFNKFMKNNLIKIIVIALIFGIASCKDQPNHTTSKKSINNEVAHELESYFDSLATHAGFNGAVLYKEADKTMFAKAYGFANFQKKTPFTINTQMEMASVSKQFTSMAIMLLRKRGGINLDNPINNYLPIALPYKNITVRHLLTHTSGLPKYEDYFYTQWPKDKLCYNKDILNYYANNKTALLFEPGSNFQYSNGGYVLLAEIVKHVSGTPLDEFLDENIFSKYHFKKTGFVDRQTILERDDYAPGYYYDTLQQKFVLPDSIDGKEYVSFLSKRLGPGRLSSTVVDLAHWENLLNTNSLLPDSLFLEMYTPQPIPGMTSNYAFGWRVDIDSLVGWHIYHSGSFGGNKTYISRFKNSPLNGLGEGLSRVKENITGKCIIPDQTLIIFNNTAMKIIGKIRSHGDLIIYNTRKNNIKADPF